MEEDYEYYGEETCAGDGMCAEKCPVSINTGHLIKSLRHTKNNSPMKKKISMTISSHFSYAQSIGRSALSAADLLHRMIGKRGMILLSSLHSRSIGKLFPSLAYHWSPFLPRPAPSLRSFFPLSSSPPPPLVRFLFDQISFYLFMLFFKSKKK